MSFNQTGSLTSLLQVYEVVLQLLLGEILLLQSVDNSAFVFTKSESDFEQLVKPELIGVYV